MQVMREYSAVAVIWKPRSRFRKEWSP